MSGAVDFVLGILGLGTSGAMHTRKAVSRAKKKAELDEMYGRNEQDTKVIEMRDRVRKEWWSIPDCSPNCLGKWRFEYPSYLGPYYQTKFWFQDHLDAKGIPYDDIILDEVSGVNFDKLQNKMLEDTISGRRRRWRIF